MKEWVKYPIGQQDFEIIREGGYLYVDKTHYIHTMLRQGGQYYFLGRPRRFGKSLFLSTLRYFFEGRRELFTGLYIDSVPYKWEAYPVLHLDLNTGNYTSPEGLSSFLDNQFEIWEKEYGVTGKAGDLSSRFRNIISAAHRKTGKRVVILVDEYDKPLVRTLNEYDHPASYRDLLSSVYANFKSSAEHIRLVFLTGVSRFSKLSIFSDLNNLRDITFDNTFADICGISLDELLHYFKEGIENLEESKGWSHDKAIAELKRNYDGYRFSAKGSDMFNPWSLLNAMERGEIEYFWNDTGLPTILAQLLKKTNADLEEIFNSYCSLSELKGLDLENPDPLPLLYQTGYLTIKGVDPETNTYKLGIPNNEVKDGLFKVLVPKYMKSDSIKGNRLVEECARNFISGKPDRSLECMQAYFSGIDYAMRMDNENNFHNAFFLLMDMIGLNAKAESHTSEGRIDITIETSRFIYVIELKFDHSAEDALRQIREKHYARQFQCDSHIIFNIGVEFSSKTRCIENWIIKQETH